VGVYYLPFENETFTTAGGSRDLWTIGASDDRLVNILAIFLANVGPDVSDAEEENIRLAIISGHNTPGSGGTAYTNETAAPATPYQIAANLQVARHNDTTIASGGSPVTVFNDGWNIREPYRMWFPPEAHVLHPFSGSQIVVRALTTPNDDISISGTLIYAEGL
jgi:hypothetical protein